MSIPKLITQKMLDAGGRFKVKSALNPILWLCAIVTGPALIFIIYLKITPPIWIIAIVMIPVICTAVGFLFLLVFDCDKLQSEDYQIRKNPDFPQLSDNSEEK